MKSIRLIALLLIALLLAGCTGAAAKGAVEIAAPDLGEAHGMTKSGERIGAREQLQEAFQEGLTAFCVRAAQQSLGPESTENAVVSPVSLYFALAALAGSAGGETREELLAAIGMEEALLRTETAKLARNMNVKDRIGTLHAAGSLWLADSFRDTLDEEAAAALADAYAMELWRTDFASDAAAERLAAWVREHTGGELGDAAAFETDPGTALMLLHAVTYEDEWLDRFDKSKTEEDTFHNADGTETICDFMNATYGIHNYSRYESGAVGCTISSLSLKHGSMTFILPDAGCTPYDVLADPEALFAIAMGNCGYGAGEVVWQIPKFDYAADADLSPALAAMGVKAAFSPERADFSGLLKEAGALPLWVGGVRQQARIRVDEDGVSAAGYTRIDYAGSPMPEGRADMILDRPFLYFIRSGAGILFAGVVNRM